VSYAKNFSPQILKRLRIAIIGLNDKRNIDRKLIDRRIDYGFCLPCRLHKARRQRNIVKVFSGSDVNAVPISA